jgi:hypothetical protein
MKGRKFLLGLIGGIILGLLVSAVPSSNSFADLTPHQQAINHAIENGCAWLRSTQIQYNSGGVEYGYWDAGFGSSAYAAGTGFALLALVSNWEPQTSNDPVVDNEHIRRATNYLLANQQGDGTWGGNQTYQVSAAIMGLASLLQKLPPGSPSIVPVQTALENAKNWLVNSQWDESCLWGSVDPSNYSYYGGFGYGEETRPDLSNTQFALVALRAAHLDPMADTWGKAVLFIENCQYKWHSDGGMWYTPDAPVWGPGSTGSMTGAGVWCYRLCNLPADDSRVQAALNWLDANYTYTENAGGYLGYSHYYYLWSAAKSFLICDIKGEIGGLIPVDPADTLAFYPGWYHDFSKYLVAHQQADGHWNTGDYNGGPLLDTEYALFILMKEVAIPYAVQVSISPNAVVVRPGEVADFTVTVENLGTEQDSYDMDVLDLPPGFLWAMTDPVMDVPGGDTAQLPLAITTPADLAIWVDTPYPFKVKATSLTDSLISHATTGTVVITTRPTPGSRVRYTDELLDALIAQVEGANIPAGVKNSLLAKLDNAKKKKEQGLERLEAGNTTVAMNMFNAAANMLGAFINEVQAQRGKKIAVGDADSLIAQAQDIIWRLRTGIWEGGMPPPPKMAGEDVQSPQGFVLSQNYPNPFNPTTQISYILPKDGHVKLEIYNLLGQKVGTLVDEYQQAGQKTVNWEAKDLSSGIYFYKLTAGDLTATKKMVLTK